MTRRRVGSLVRALVGVLLGVLVAGLLTQCGSSGGTGSAPAAGTIAASALPVEARDTLALIEAGGPFPYDRDGIVFENRERLLPSEPGGYYHEYTVPTPGSEDRGARRIITGDHGERYYTGDHYSSFERIVT